MADKTAKKSKIKTKTKGVDKKVKGKKVKDKKVKKEKSTGGFPKNIVLTKEEDGLMLHDAEFSDINSDSVVGIYQFRRVVNIEVQRKQKRVAQD